MAKNKKRSRGRQQQAESRGPAQRTEQNRQSERPAKDAQMDPELTETMPGETGHHNRKRASFGHN
jgi:hypothetical protein